MEVLANTAIKAQLSTLPQSDQDLVASLLQELAHDPKSIRDHLEQFSTDKKLWKLRITSRLRAIVRIENDRIEIVAIARPDQLRRYNLKDSAG